MSWSPDSRKIRLVKYMAYMAYIFLSTYMYHLSFLDSLFLLTARHAIFQEEDGMGDSTHNPFMMSTTNQEHLPDSAV